VSESAESRDAAAHLRLRLPRELRTALRSLALRRHTSMSQVVRVLVEREVKNSGEASGSQPDESAIREMAILIAVELVLKLQEATIPGGPTLSRRLVEDAARAAIARVEMVELSLRRSAR
jgi:hypothetical protein